ncbi:hypothetical protein HY091_03030 [Candidatus Kaiserbacteria bacterium]|nr:hypothetical protein [Candidatus Kaiserbacteria bacterium]
MKYLGLIVALVAIGFIAFHFIRPGVPAVEQEQLPPGIVAASWQQPQACPQYGGANQCYVPEGAYGGYDNWAATRATFIWRVNPCPEPKKVTHITAASCVYETNDAQGRASTTVDQGSAIVDCRAFAAQFKNDACNCNNGITLSAKVQCE